MLKCEWFEKRLILEPNEFPIFFICHSICCHWIKAKQKQKVSLKVLIAMVFSLNNIYGERRTFVNECFGPLAIRIVWERTVEIGDLEL